MSRPRDARGGEGQGVDRVAGFGGDGPGGEVFLFRHSPNW